HAVDLEVIAVIVVRRERESAGAGRGGIARPEDRAGVDPSVHTAPEVLDRRKTRRDIGDGVRLSHGGAQLNVGAEARVDRRGRTIGDVSLAFQEPIRFGRHNALDVYVAGTGESNGTGGNG